MAVRSNKFAPFVAKMKSLIGWLAGLGWDGMTCGELLAKYEEEIGKHGLGDPLSKHQPRRTQTSRLLIKLPSHSLPL